MTDTQEPIVAVHWLAFTLPRSTPDQALEVLRSVAPFECFDIEGGWQGYEHQRVDGLGARIAWTERRSDVHVELRGKRCESLSADEQRKLLMVAEMAGAKVTRLDLALDDVERLLEPREVWAAVERGELTGHTTVQQRILGRRNGEPCGETDYIGSARSRQRVRVYDKAAEMRGREQCALESIVTASTSSSLAPSLEARGVRWEIQCREEPAETLAAQLRASAPGKWGEVWVGRLLSILDFREVAGVRADRRERCAWFVRLVGAAQKVRAYVAVPARTLAQVKVWIEHQVAPTLAVLVQAMGGDLGYLLDVLEGGKSRWRLRHRMLLAGA